MTTEEKYNELLKEIAEVIKGKNEKIALQNGIIDGLKFRLEMAEKQINKTKGSENN